MKKKLNKWINNYAEIDKQKETLAKINHKIMMQKTKEELALERMNNISVKIRIFKK